MWLFLTAFLLLAVRLALDFGISFGRLGGGVGRRLFGNRQSVNKPTPGGVSKETSRKGWDVLGKEIVAGVFMHFGEELSLQFNGGDDHFGIKIVVAQFDLVGIDGILGEGCKVHENLVDFCHKKHWQVRHVIDIVTHPSFGFLIFDELNDLPSKLLEDGLACCHVNHCKLDATHIGAGHRGLFHIINAANTFNHQGNLASVFFNNPPVDFVPLLIHLGGGFFYQFPIPLWSVEERIDVG